MYTQVVYALSQEYHIGSRHAGVSLTVTTVTDVSAFAVGAITVSQEKSVASS